MDNNTDPYVLEHTEKHVGWITLNRPDQRNPLSINMLNALSSALVNAENNNDVRVIVIASKGSIFSAGHDLKEMSKQAHEDVNSQQCRMRSILDKCSSLMQSIAHSPKAVIACVQGTATAAGCQLVSACDLAIAATSAKFCTPGVNIGGFCTTPLVGVGRNIHRKHAMAMALTGDAIDACQAERFGLINEEVADELLTEHVTKLAEHIASKSAQGIQLGKSDFYKQIDMPLADAFEFANEAMIKAMTSEDAQEGKTAFFEKRIPKWQGA